MENFLFLAFLLATGKLLYHRGFPADFGRSLNLFVINISLPAMVLYEVPKLSLDSSLTLYIIMPWSILVFSVMLLWVLFRFINVDKGIRAALYLLIPLGNTSFVGIPMVEAFYGQSHIPQALIYDQFGTFIIFATYGTVLVSLFSGEQINLINVAKKIVIFPSFIALFIALLLPVPQIFEPMLKTLSMTLVPLAIISVGFSLRLKMEKHKMIFAIGLFIKLLILPMAALAVVKLSGYDIKIAKIAVFQAGMAPMITAGILAISAGFAPRFSAALVGYGIIASFGTLPLLYLLLERISG